MKKSNKLNFMVNQKSLLPGYLLLAILIIGGFLRFYELSTQSLWMDEGFSINTLKNYLEFNEINNNPLFIIILSWGAKLFDFNEFGLRYFPALFGTFTILISFILAKILFPFNRSLPWIIALFIAISYWEIAWSRQIRMYSIEQFFFLSGLLIFYIEFLKKEYDNFQDHFKSIYFYLLPLLVIAAIFTHQFGGLLIPIFIFSILLIQKNNKYKLILSTILSVMVIIIIFKFPDLKNGVFNPKNDLKYYWRYLLDSHLIITSIGLMSMTIGYIITHDREKKAIGFLNIAVLTTFFALSFFGPLLNYRYLFPIFPLIVILALYYIEEIIFRNQNIIFKIILLICSIFLIIQSNELIFKPQTNYYLEKDSTGHQGYRVKTPQPDFKIAHQKIASLKNTNSLIISGYPEITNFYLQNTDYYLPFDLEEQIPWHQLNITTRTNIPAISNLMQLYQITHNNNGFIILDAYSKEKLPEDVIAYIEYNTELIMEKWEKDTSDSGIFIYKF